MSVLVFDIITIFPGFFEGPLNHGIIRKARENSLIDTRVHDLRKYTEDRHNTVDDRPFGGGRGMVLKPEPIFNAVEALPKSGESIEIVALSAAGRSFSQSEALRLSGLDQIVLICGRYEGIDERVVEHLATTEISIGNYVVSGGEVAAAVVVDAVTRYVPGAVGKEESILKDSFSDPGIIGMQLEHPHYTRPARFRGLGVPDVLLSGDHAAVARWRRTESLRKTLKNRPDLMDADAYEEVELGTLGALDPPRYSGKQSAARLKLKADS